MKYRANPVEVRAYKIVGVGPQDANDGSIRLELEGEQEVTATAPMMARMMPEEGDYWVTQEDGYEYLNPKAVFERKYTMVSDEESSIPIPLKRRDNSLIDNIFTYHAPFGDQAKRYESLRMLAKSLAYAITGACPESREKSLAITSLQQTIMWANAAIAINEKEIKA